MPETSGYQKLWSWFGLSYASWITLPRVLVHEMPDEWQSKMAVLLEEFDNTWDTSDIGINGINISLRKSGRFIKIPSWLSYRHPDIKFINNLRSD